MNEREMAMFQNLTHAIEKLTKAMYDTSTPVSASFHKRQIPALKRQTDLVEFIRVQRQAVLDKQDPTFSRKWVLEVLDTAGKMLISS